MIRINDIGRVLAAVLVAVVFVGILTPLCTMPTCDRTVSEVCGDFQPACEKCPEPVLMKHSSDEAVPSAAPVLVQPAIVAQLTPSATPLYEAAALIVPDVTASPPPHDPLGVRLTV